jgi:hypothetical protein
MWNEDYGGEMVYGNGGCEGWVEGCGRLTPFFIDPNLSFRVPKYIL